MSGFVVIQREALDHHIVGDPQRFYAWCWMIASAVWKPTKFDIQGKTITLKRGQLCASRTQMADAWGWSPSAVERFLTRLQTEQMIGRETGQGRSVITIENYDKYQSTGEQAGQATGQATGQRPDSDRTAKEQGNHRTIVEEEASASPSTARGGVRNDPFPRPEWADPQVWADLKANRKAKRLPCTATAHTKLLRDLAKLANDEWPPGRLLEAIVGLGWAAAYDPRPKLNRDSPNGSASNFNGTGKSRNGAVAYLEGRAEARRAGQGSGQAERHPTGDDGGMGELAFDPAAARQPR